jgi:hypothetical protein
VGLELSHGLNLAALPVIRIVNAWN